MDFVVDKERGFGYDDAQYKITEISSQAGC